MKTSLVTTQVVLASRPTGWVDESNFRLVTSPLPPIEEGEVLVRNHFLSLDPYMRGRMNDAPSYAPPVAIGAVMVGATVGEVIESRSPGLRVGDRVTGMLGWQTHGIAKRADLRKVDTSRVPISAYLGVVGMPGVTAYVGLLDIGAPKAGETVVVSAAAGAVGSVVGQLAKLQGCRAVGIAGGPAKCKSVVHDLGFDACVDYKSPSFDAELSTATPNGIDVYFENVGGRVMDTVLPKLNPFARVPLCGLVSQYNETVPYGVKSLSALLWKRVKLQGFIVSDHLDRFPEALSALAVGVAEGKLRYRETVAVGIENAPRAFIGMLKGENLGKQVVKLVE